MNLEALARPNVLEIDLSVVERNTAAIRRLIGAKTWFFATVKADAYGMGLLACAPSVLRAGADGLSLSNLDDAVRLRRSGISQPILVYAGATISPDMVEAVREYDLIPSLHSTQALQSFARHAGAQPLRVALKIEVGPERLGIVAEEAAAAVRQLRDEHPNLSVHVVHCHPNFPVEATPPLALEWQYERFRRFIEDVEAGGIDLPLKVLASTKTLERSGDRMLLNAVDPGSALFGVDAQGRSPLRALRSRLLQARPVTRDEHLADSPFLLRPGMRVGVIPMGYSDGLHRAHCGAVLLRGKRVPILGKPSLEYTRIDVTEVPDATEGDEVVVIGSQGAETISADEVRRAQGAARIQDTALEIRATVLRRYVRDSVGD